jgi:hypothetical protein
MVSPRSGKVNVAVGFNPRNVEHEDRVALATIDQIAIIQPSLRDGESFWTHVPWAKAPRLHSNHRYAMKNGFAAWNCKHQMAFAA